jgi:rhodanese-related sulfurtransferase
MALVYDPESRRVLGVQAVGDGETVKRIDVATQFISQGGTIDHLGHMEHAYAPPYSPAIDPLGTLAFAAQNQEDGVEAVTPLQDLDEATVLDVRLPDEVEERSVSGKKVQSVPVADLRQSMDSVDPDISLTICHRGTRSAEAVRILRSTGRDSRYVGGGLKWRLNAGKNSK